MSKNDAASAVDGLKFLQLTIGKLIESNEAIDYSELMTKFRQKALLRRILCCLEIELLKNTMRKSTNKNKVSLRDA